MRTLRVGIVGAGYAGKFHFESFQHVRGIAVEVVGVTSKRPESCEKFARERGIRAFDSLDAMLGEVDDYLEIFANNHRARCRINPGNLLDVYNPKHEQMKDIYLVEKISTQEGWTPAAPDENWILGYHHELQDFMACIAEGREPICGLDLAVNTMLIIYAAYLSDERKGAEVAVR